MGWGDWVWLTCVYLVTNVEFETGSKELAELHEKVYVGSGRFVLEAGKPTMVEYKVSEVSA